MRKASALRPQSLSRRAGILFSNAGAKGTGVKGAPTRFYRRIQKVKGFIGDSGRDLSANTTGPYRFMNDHGATGFFALTPISWSCPSVKACVGLSPPD